MKTNELIAYLAQAIYIFSCYLALRHWAGWSRLGAAVAALPLGFIATWITMMTIGIIRDRNKGARS